MEPSFGDVPFYDLGPLRLLVGYTAIPCPQIMPCKYKKTTRGLRSRVASSPVKKLTTGTPFFIMGNNICGLSTNSCPGHTLPSMRKGVHSRAWDVC